MTNEWHPLFPPSDDDDDPDATPPDVQEIYVRRKDNGKYVSAPRTFMSAELTSLAALHAEFGGGEYELAARDSLKRIVRRVIHILPGPQKPLFDSGPEDIPAAKPAQQASNPMSLLGASPEGGIMGIVMMIMQNMMQQGAQAAERQTQIMIAMMQSSATMSQTQLAAAQENMRLQSERDQRDKQSQIELMLKLTESKGSGNSSGSEDSFFKGVEFMRHFSTQQIENLKAQAKGGGDLDLEGIIGTVLEALQGFNAFKEMSGGGLPVPAVEPS